MGRRLFAILTLLPLDFSASIHTLVTGPAAVTDGDSRTVTGHQTRLFGINAPESKQNLRLSAALPRPVGSQARHSFGDDERSASPPVHRNR